MLTKRPPEGKTYIFNPQCLRVLKYQSTREKNRNLLFGTKYSRMDQVKSVEDSL